MALRGARAHVSSRTLVGWLGLWEGDLAVTSPLAPRKKGAFALVDGLSAALGWPSPARNRPSLADADRVLVPTHRDCSLGAPSRSQAPRRLPQRAPPPLARKAAVERRASARSPAPPRTRRTRLAQHPGARAVWAGGLPASRGRRGAGAAGRSWAACGGRKLATRGSVLRAHFCVFRGRRLEGAPACFSVGGWLGFCGFSRPPPPRVVAAPVAAGIRKSPGSVPDIGFGACARHLGPGFSWSGVSSSLGGVRSLLRCVRLDLGEGRFTNLGGLASDTSHFCFGFDRPWVGLGHLCVGFDHRPGGKLEPEAAPHSSAQSRCLRCSEACTFWGSKEARSKGRAVEHMHARVSKCSFWGGRILRCVGRKTSCGTRRARRRSELLFWEEPHKEDRGTSWTSGKVVPQACPAQPLRSSLARTLASTRIVCVCAFACLASAFLVDPSAEGRLGTLSFLPSRPVWAGGASSRVIASNRGASPLGEGRS